jgi:hypothetical protein
MSDIGAQKYLDVKDSPSQYLYEYRLLDRITRMDRSKLKKTYTERKLKQVFGWINEGRGLGRGESYSPWIRITRGFSSPVSHQMFSSLSIHKRNHHFLSKLEHHTALQLAYLGAVELRECLPLWPTEHQHPIEIDPKSRTVGLMDIARDAGIEHGNFVGSDVPYIASVDMMATIQWKGKTHHLGVSCKPKEILMGSIRAQERATLDEIYCRTVGAMHLREGGSQFNPTLIKNLQAYQPAQHEVLKWASTGQLQDFCNHLNLSYDGQPLHAAITQTGKVVRIGEPLASTLWRVGIWVHLIDIDMGQRISMLKPIKRGKERCLGLLAAHFLGDAK